MDMTNMNAEQYFSSLVKQFHDVLVEYKRAFQAADQNVINSKSALLIDCVQHMYTVYQQCASTQPEIANKAAQMIMQYNAYVETYSAFIAELKNGYGERSNQLAQKAEIDFAKLMNIVLNCLA